MGLKGVDLNGLGEGFATGVGGGVATGVETGVATGVEAGLGVGVVWEISGVVTPIRRL